MDQKREYESFIKDATTVTDQSRKVQKSEKCAHVFNGEETGITYIEEGVPQQRSATIKSVDAGCKKNQERFKYR